MSSMDTVERPAQVGRAVILLWVSLVGGIAVSLLELDSSLFAGMDGFMWSFLAATVFTYLLFGALIVFASRRKNWARIVILVLTILGVIVMLVPWPGLDDEYWTLSTAASPIGFLILDAVALYWLFTGAGAAWFSRNEGAASPG